MSAIKFINTGLLVRGALGFTILALNACTAFSSRPADQARDCNTDPQATNCPDTLEQPLN